MYVILILIVFLLTKWYIFKISQIYCCRFIKYRIITSKTYMDFSKKIQTGFQIFIYMCV